MKQITAFLLFGISVAASAHHSRAEFNTTDITEVSGEVVSVAWRNPHIEFRLRTVGQDGSVEQWHIEAGNATAASRMGLDRDTLQPGFEIKVAGITSSRRANRMVAGQYLLPSGLEVLIDPQITPTPRWSPQRYVDRRNSTYQPSGSLPDDGRGIFRIWTRERPEEFWMLRPADYYPLTEAAETAVASWDEEDPADNQILQCIPPGMPAITGGPHPIEFVELDGAIELRQQAFDVVRTIHLEPAENPASIDPSPLGYSTGRWEDNALIVTTTRVSAPYLNRRGVPMSEAAEIEEQFTVDAANGHLNYVLTVTDPEYLSEPVVEEIRWFWSEDATMQRFDCAVSG